MIDNNKKFKKLDTLIMIKQRTEGCWEEGEKKEHRTEKQNKMDL